MEKLSRLADHLPFRRQQPDFGAVRQTDDSDTESQGLMEKRHGSKTTTSILSTKCGPITWTNCVLLLINIGLLINSSRHFLFREKNAALREVSSWSPIFDDIEIPRYTTFMNGTVNPLPEVSMAREEPGPENDAKWEFYEHVPTSIVNREAIIKLGKNPDTAAKFDDDIWGFGEDAYMVQLDIVHQMHCLNAVRKAAFATYPGYIPTGAAPPKPEHPDRNWWTHLGHCVDILLQNIKCNANTGLVTLAWVEGRQSPWPDFSIQQKCRDFDAIYNWQVQRAVSEETISNAKAPKDAFVWPNPMGGPSELGIILGQHHQQEGQGPIE